VTPFLVGIAGGSGSGKTTLARGLVASLGPDHVALVAHDAYYVDRRDLLPSERTRLNYDVPEALDRELFRAQLAALKRGEPVVPPRYCFQTHRRDGAGEPIEPRRIVLIEGIMLLHDPEVRQAFDLRIFVDAPEGVRLGRRVHRDTTERGRTAESVITQCRLTVFPAHGRYVEPTRAWADVVLVNLATAPALVEVAASVIRTRLARRHGDGAASPAAA
jgi:uridine kinase